MITMIYNPITMAITMIYNQLLPITMAIIMIYNQLQWHYNDLQ